MKPPRTAKRAIKRTRPRTYASIEPEVVVFVGALVALFFAKLFGGPSADPAAAPPLPPNTQPPSPRRPRLRLIASVEYVEPPAPADTEPGEGEDLPAPAPARPALTLVPNEK